MTMATTATATSSTLELRDRTESDGEATSDSLVHAHGTGDDAVEGRHEFSLPPVDRGKDAWFFLAACFFVEALTWGTNKLSAHCWRSYFLY